ncbi:MAG: hypothetical protein QXS20_06765 [Candidatus Thorarchaeota archaeon]
MSGRQDAGAYPWERFSIPMLEGTETQVKRQPPLSPTIPDDPFGR